MGKLKAYAVMADDEIDGQTTIEGIFFDKKKALECAGELTDSEGIELKDSEEMTPEETIREIEIELPKGTLTKSEAISSDEILIGGLERLILDEDKIRIPLKIALSEVKVFLKSRQAQTGKEKETKKEEGK